MGGLGGPVTSITIRVYYFQYISFVRSDFSFCFRFVSTHQIRETEMVVAALRPRLRGAVVLRGPGRLNFRPRPSTTA